MHITTLLYYYTVLNLQYGITEYGIQHYKDIAIYSTKIHIHCHKHTISKKELVNHTHISMGTEVTGEDVVGCREHDNVGKVVGEAKDPVCRQVAPLLFPFWWPLTASLSTFHTLLYICGLRLHWCCL